MKNYLKKQNIKWWIGTVSCFLLFFSIGVFAYMKMSFVANGVDIKVDLLADKDSSLVEVSGNAKNATYVSLNGREIFIDKEGNFKEHLALLPGFSLLTLEAQDKFGKDSEKKFEMMYEENSAKFAFKESIIKNN